MLRRCDYLDCSFCHHASCRLVSLPTLWHETLNKVVDVSGHCKNSCIAYPWNMDTKEAWNLKVSHFSDCLQQQSNPKNQNKVSDQNTYTCKDPLLQPDSILTALLLEADYKGGNNGIINHFYQEKPLHSGCILQNLRCHDNITVTASV